MRAALPDKHRYDSVLQVPYLSKCTVARVLQLRRRMVQNLYSSSLQRAAGVGRRAIAQLQQEDAECPCICSFIIRITAVKLARIDHLQGTQALRPCMMLACVNVRRYGCSSIGPTAQALDGKARQDQAF